MNRYLLFSGDDYYPSGGWQDFRGDFETIEKAKEHFLVDKDGNRDWMHVVDSTDGRIVFRGSYDEDENEKPFVKEREKRHWESR